MGLSPETLALGLIRYVVFLFSTTCHEASHALAAKIGGDDTAARGGQVSLNPIPHIQREIFGMVIVPMLALFLGGAMLGWASAPFDPDWQRRYPKRAAWMALAGPMANFTLMVLAGIAIRIGMIAGVFHSPESITFYTVTESIEPGVMEGLAKVVSIFFSLNLMLGVFNLLPIPPLDGFSVLGLFVPEDTARRLEDMRGAIGMYSMLALMVGWKAFSYVYDPIFLFAINLLYPGSHYG